MDILIFAITLVAAFLFSLGGIGSSIILIPLLVTLGIPLNAAKPVGLFTSMVSLTGASINNIKNKRLDYKLGIPIIISAVIFAIIGAHISKYIPVKFIIILFILFLFVSGFTFLLKKKKNDDEYRNDVPYILLSLVGAFAGLLSGMLGIGGGSVISSLLLMLGFNPKKIAVTTASVVPFSAFSGFMTYWAMGNIDWKILIIASVAGLIGATLGTIFMQKRLNTEVVEKILAVILLVMAVKLIFNIL